MGEYVQLDDYNKKCCMFDSTATYVEEKSGGGQHLNLAAGVSSLFPGQAVWVTTTKDVSFYPFTSTVWKCQDDNASLYKHLITKHMHYDRFGHTFGPNGF